MCFVLFQTCRYYLNGKCHYGDKCRYDHVRLKDSYQSESKKRYIQLHGHVTMLLLSFLTSHSVNGPASLPSLIQSSSEAVLPRNDGDNTSNVST